MITLKELRNSLYDVADVAEASGGKNAGRDIRLLNEMLSGDDNASALSAIDELECAISDPTAPLRKSYITLLEAAGTDKNIFDKTFNALKCDRQIKKNDIDHIAHAYIGGREKWPSKKAALEAIERRFIEIAYHESRMKILSKTKVW